MLCKAVLRGMLSVSRYKPSQKGRVIMVKAFGADRMEEGFGKILVLLNCGHVYKLTFAPYKNTIPYNEDLKHTDVTVYCYPCISYRTPTYSYPECRIRCTVCRYGRQMGINIDNAWTGAYKHHKSTGHITSVMLAAVVVGTTEPPKTTEQMSLFDLTTQPATPIMELAAQPADPPPPF